MDRIRRWSWVLLLALALLVLLFSLGAIAVGVDVAEFEQSAGVAWASVPPGIEGYLIRLERLIGVGYAAFAVVWAWLAWSSVRRGDRRGWTLLWSMPVTFAGAAAAFLVSGAQGLGAYYGALAALAVLGLLLSNPESGARSAS